MLKRRAMRTLFIALLLLSAACIVEAPSSGPTPQVPGTASAATPGASSAPRRSGAPAINQRIGAVLDNKVEVTAVTVMPGALVPGDAVRISILFNVLEDLKDDYLVFVHVEDVDGRVERMNLDHKPNNGKTPTNEWKKGQTISDDFFLMLPPGVPLRALTLYAGLWEPQRDVRLKITNPDKAPNDGNDRIRLVTIPVAR